tara:strand:- start:25 stop:381 length:357 start_codon:yes stop_codon:yes gene_type:complete
MEPLLNTSTMSIAELRKVLSDNDVIETSVNNQSKEDLLEQVKCTLLTQLMIDELVKSEDDVTELSRSIESSKKSKEIYDRNQLRLEQEIEYAEALEQDMNYELSPKTLRAKRVKYYEQ